MMGMMHWLLKSKLKEFQDDVFSKMTITMNLPSDDVYASEATVINGGEITIQRKLIECYVFNLWNQDGGGIHRLGESRAPGSHHAHIVSGRNSVTLGSLYNVPMAAAGDAETDYCLSIFQNPSPVVCADVEVDVWYTLETDPNALKEKSARFWTSREPWEPMKWIQEPVGSPGSYCPESGPPHG